MPEPPSIPPVELSSDSLVPDSASAAIEKSLNQNQNHANVDEKSGIQRAQSEIQGIDRAQSTDNIKDLCDELVISNAAVQRSRSREMQLRGGALSGETAAKQDPVRKAELASGYGDPQGSDKPGDHADAGAATVNHLLKSSISTLTGLEEDSSTRGCASAAVNAGSPSVQAPVASGKKYFSYADIHKTMSSLVPQLKEWNPDVMVALAAGDSFPHVRP